MTTTDEDRSIRFQNKTKEAVEQVIDGIKDMRDPGNDALSNLVELSLTERHLTDLKRALVEQAFVQGHSWEDIADQLLVHVEVLVEDYDFDPDDDTPDDE